MAQRNELYQTLEYKNVCTDMCRLSVSQNGLIELSQVFIQTGTPACIWVKLPVNIDFS